MNKQKFVIYVDDDPDDIEIVSELFTSFPGETQLKTFNKPDEALLYLQTLKEVNEEVCYVLIDVNLRTYSGFELINKIKAIPHLQHLPLTLITTSRSLREQEMAAKLEVDLFIKPSTVNDLSVIVKQIVDQCNNNRNTVDIHSKEQQ